MARFRNLHGVPKSRTKQPDPDDRVIELMNRIRLSIPFPVDPGLVARSLLPEIASQDPHPCQMENLKLTMEWGHVVTISLDDIVDYEREQFESLFWLRVPRIVPVAQDRTKPFRMWPENPYWKSVSAWFSKALKLDHELVTMAEAFRQYFQYVSTASEMRVTWPELAKFVRLPGAMMLHMPDSERFALAAQIRQLFPLKRRNKAIEMLTAATLLDSTELSAWPGYVP